MLRQHSYDMLVSARLFQAWAHLMPGGQTAGWLHARPFCDIAAGIFNKQAKSANIVVPQQEPRRPYPGVLPLPRAKTV